MTCSGTWITEICTLLQSFGASITVVNKFSFRINDRLFAFIPAGSSRNLNTKSAVIIHEDLFHTCKNQLIMRLKSQLGLNEFKVHGRSTRVQEITRNQAKKFVDENHLMGFGGGKIFLGLFHKDVLVAVAVFSRSLFMKYEEPPYYSVELERYCSLANTTVVGGLDKLITHFEKNYPADDLVTTVDLEWSEGKSYLKLGFEEIGRTSPLLFAVDRKTFNRRIILSPADLNTSEYLIQNRGNLRLRKQMNKGKGMV